MIGTRSKNLIYPRGKLIKQLQDGPSSVYKNSSDCSLNCTNHGSSKDRSQCLNDRSSKLQPILNFSKFHERSKFCPPSIGNENDMLVITDQSLTKAQTGREAYHNHFKSLECASPNGIALFEELIGSAISATNHELKDINPISKIGAALLTEVRKI